MKELKEFIRFSIELMDSQKVHVGLDEDKTKLFEQLKDLQVKLNLPVVNRSIGKDTKLVLITMTRQQVDEHKNPCELCILKDKCDRNVNIFDKCVAENGLNQYYG